MGLSKERKSSCLGLSCKSSLELEKLLHDLEEEQDKAFKAKDLDRIANCYHPHAVAVHKGVRASYGADGQSPHVYDIHPPF